MLEPALAARSGRIDLAVEIGLPDTEGRRRLLQLYGVGLDLRLDDTEAVIDRTEQVSPAFIKMLRKGSLLAARDTPEGDLVVTDAHVNAAARSSEWLALERTGWERDRHDTNLSKLHEQLAQLIAHKPTRRLRSKRLDQEDVSALVLGGRRRTTC